VNLEIRIAAHRDVHESMKVSLEAFESVRSVYRPNHEAMRRQKDRKMQGTRLVADLDGRTVGTLQFSEHKDHLHIMDLGVLPDFQRKGIGTRLVQWVCESAPRLGFGKIRADTIEETGNVEFFKRLGFVPVERRTAEWCESERFDAVHEVVLERCIE
jgi:GNAT superfamily N-acetyltransferase